MSVIKSGGYDGVFYDVECIKQASHRTGRATTFADFQASFEAATAAGLKVILGTSYAAPMMQPVGTGGCPGAEPSTPAIWAQMIRDPNVVHIRRHQYTPVERKHACTSECSEQPGGAVVPLKPCLYKRRSCVCMYLKIRRHTHTRVNTRALSLPQSREL